MKHSSNIQALRQTKLCCCLLVLVSFILTNCGGAAPGEPADESAVRVPTPSIAPALAQPVSPVPVSVASAAPASAVSSPVVTQGPVIRVDSSQNVHPISPLIYGMNQAPKEQLEALGIKLNRWAATPAHATTGSSVMPGTPAEIISIATAIMATLAARPAMILSPKRSLLAGMRW